MPKKSKKQSLQVRRLFSNPLAVFVVLLAVASAILFIYKSQQQSVKIGLNIEKSGDLSAVGISSEKGAQLAASEINKNGGIEIGGKKYKVKLEVKDNFSNEREAASVVPILIEKGVLALVGPNASKYAIAAADLAEANQTLMVSPWSTNAQTTLNSSGTPKDYVFRAAFLDSFQGEALALFAFTNLQAKTAAVMYDETADVLKGQADIFEDAFREGSGRALTVQTLKVGDGDFSQQLRAIAHDNPDVVFLPAYYNDAAKIIKQAKAMGIKSVFLGSDAWGGQEILNICGPDCNGAYLSAHFSKDSQNPQTKAFVQAYQKEYGVSPDDVAALSFDSVNLIAQAISNGGMADRQSAAQGMYKITEFDGVTGRMVFEANSRDPKKSVSILQINNSGFDWEENMDP
jgi:branched-chain amino acid transport system substrate-binding protein